MIVSARGYVQLHPLPNIHLEQGHAINDQRPTEMTRRPLADNQHHLSGGVETLRAQRSLQQLNRKTKNDIVTESLRERQAYMRALFWPIGLRYFADEPVVSMILMYAYIAQVL
jgi:hypothetical protein